MGDSELGDHKLDVDSFIAGLRVTLKRLPPCVDRLADMGWSLPMSMPISEIDDLSHQSPDEVDEYMLQLFSEEGSWRFEHMLESMVYKEVLRPWAFMIAQCGDAYLAGHFLVTVPCLLSVLEGVAVGGPGTQGNVHRALGSISSVSPGDSLVGDVQALAIRASQRFAQHVFRGVAFDDERPAVINRNWILHGRDVAHWQQADSLRLFVAVNALAIALDGFGLTSASS